MKKTLAWILWYLKQNLIAIDQGANALLGGHADETLSSRAYRADRDGRVFGRIFRPLVDAIFFFEPEHCKGSYLAERNQAQQTWKLLDPNYL